MFEGVQVALDSGSMVRMEKCAKGKLGVISNSPLVPADSYPLSQQKSSAETELVRYRSPRYSMVGRAKKVILGSHV